MAIWKEKNDPLYYLTEDQLDYEPDYKYIQEEYHPEDDYIEDTELDNDYSSESEYDDDQWY